MLNTFTYRVYLKNSAALLSTGSIQAYTSYAARDLLAAMYPGLDVLLNP